jgi:phage shock protein PspC (stress-responsive transcriptional regulator)
MHPQTTPDRRLTRNTDDKMIAGVCAGLADYFGVDPTLVRAGYVLLSIFTTGFPGLLVYIILMFVMPKE